MQLRPIVILLIASLAAGTAGGKAAATKAGTKTTKPRAAKLSAAPSPRYQSCVQRTRRGIIDWTAGHILASGVGKVRDSTSKAVLDARKVARLVAARNAVLMIASVPVDPNGKNIDIGRSKISVESAARDLEEAGIQYDPRKRTVTVTLRVPLYGVEGLVRKTGVVVARKGSKWDWPKSAKPDRPAARIKQVVIDARGTKFSPVMFPTLQTAKGRRVFDASDVPRKELFRRPLVIYASAARKPRLPGKASTKPADGRIILRPTRSKGKANGTLVLSEDDLAKLAAHGEARDLMKAGKVVILTGAGK